MATEVLFKLNIDKSDGKATFDEIKRDIADLDRNAKVGVGFKNLTELKSELAQVQRIRDRALDFKTAEAAQRDVKRLEKEIENLNKDLGKVGQGNVFQRIGEQAKGASKDILSFAAGGVLSGGIAAAADLAKQGIAAVIDIGSKFESGVADLGAITGIAGQDLDNLGEKARDLALEFGTSATDQLESFKGILSRLGPDIASVPEALGSITESVNILSKATGDDAAASMDALTTAALQFGTDLSDPIAAADDITKKMNTMAAGAKVGAAEVPQVAEALKQAGVAAKGANVSFEEANAGIQVLAAGGKVGSEAGVAMRNVIGLLQKQSAEGERAFKSLGTSTAEVSKLLTEQGLGAALEKVQAGMKGLGSDAERNKTLITLFGQESSAAAGILLDNTAKLDEFTKGVTGTNTAVEQAEIRQATFSERIAKVGAFFEDLAITVFKGVGDGINFVIDNFELLTNALLPPIGAVVSLIKHFDDLVAIGEDVGNFFGLISDVDAANSDAARTVESVVDAYEQYTKAIGEADDAVKEATGQVDMVKRLGELQNATDLTAKDQAELAKLTGDLADKFPEAVAGVNDLTGEYEVNLEKLKELSAEEEKTASDDKRRLIEENLIGPTKDLLPALDAQKEKLAELRQELDDAIQSGDKDDILEAKAAYEEQRDAIKGTTEQLELNIKALIQSGAVGKGSAEEIAKGLGISRAEAEKLIPKVQQINKDLAEQKKRADEVAQSAQGMAAAFNEAANAAKQQFNEELGALNEIDRQIRENLKKRGKARTAADDEQLKQLRKSRKEQFDATKKADKESDALAAISQSNADLFTEKKEKAGQSAFEREKARLDREAKDRETQITNNENDLTDAAIDAFLAGKRKEAELTKSEEAALAKERLDALKKQREDVVNTLAKTDAEGNIVGLKLAVKEGEEAKTLTELQALVADLNSKIAAQKKNLVKVDVVVTDADKARFQKEIQDLINQQAEQEISLGIRPQEDTFDLIDLKIDALKKSIGENQLKLKFDTEGNPIGVTEDLIKANADATREITALQSQSTKLRMDMDNELKGLRIANIEDVAAREREELLLKQELELAEFRIREASGGQLTAEEQERKKLIEQRHARELKALKDKLNAEFDLQSTIGKQTQDLIIGQLTSVARMKSNLSKEETAAQQNEFLKREQDLRAQLSKGVISQTEFTAEMKKLAKERSDFEIEQSGFSFAALAKGAKDAYTKALENATTYFDDLFQKYVVNAALHQIMEATMTADATAGATTREAINSGQAASNLVVAETSVLKGATETAASAIASLGWLGIPVAIAASLAFSLAMSKLVSLIAFEKGGVLVGEKGPEIIASKRDFAQFATQLTMMTRDAIERKMGERNTTESGGGSSGSSPIRVKVSGTISGRGRTVKSVIDSDTLNRRSEVLGVR